ncbi:hypothetical protein TWF703_006734 [Orbilia oligospora]|uniref:Uncharacterized protein n=1 Tax=Orbilia oligospora TaxID=2813651 RepID=A0A7C8P0U6_ORBOL|nr:hypothetical protein TWF703_006734 [Orbilia oligospora]
MPSVFSCFGRIFKRRKNMKISSPMETTPEGPRPARNASKPPLSVKTPNLSTFGTQTAPGPRSPNLVYSNNNSRGSIISRRPNVTNSNPTISVTTPAATSFPLTSPQVPNFFTKSSSSSPSQEDIDLTDEKKNSSSSSEFPRTPGTFDFDATPRIHRIFKMLSPPPTKLIFTEAVRPEPVIVEPKESMASRISKRLSRRWTSKNMNFNTSNTNISITPSSRPQDLGTPRSIPEMCYSPQYIPGVSYESSLPSSPRQCLTTRLPNGEVKPVTMVPQLKLSVPIFSRVQTLEATPIEASPVCDPWRHRKEEIEGMSFFH